ncbi:MAG TPA: cation:proton antiporter [Tepidisphaeraceae bacterium]|nr:cation:proton antiporter [Tepidisphaeraceae bacterium]
MHGNLLLILLLQIALVLALSRLMGWLANRINQPQVVGEMVAGIMLGPSLLAWAAPELWTQIFRPDLIPGSGIHADPTQYLSMLSQVGVIFFLFLIGLELDPKLIRNRGHAAVVISHVSIIAPFLLGAGLAIYLYGEVFTATPAMRFTSVALFMGAAMSITAFPVLARILTERNLHKTKVGAITITCAAVDDVTAWCMLAFVVGIARATGFKPAMMTAGLSVAYVAVMFFAVRPFLRRLEAVYERQGRLSQNVVALIFLMILASAFATEKIGIHALFGAFLMGAVMPKGTRFVRHLSEKLEDYTVVFLLPIFFAYTGLKTQINLLNDPQLWVMTLIVILVACAGKFGGSTLAARACGMDWRESTAIGILMNTRGLMELVILNIGRDLGVITDAVFAMMVIMALVTTALTTPILNWVYPQRLFDAAPAPDEPRAPGARGRFTALIPVSDPNSGGPLVRLATALAGPAELRKVVALHLKRPVDREAYRAGLDEAHQPADPVLEPLLATARQENVDVETVSFISTDVPDDIASVARSHRADLVLMGFHRPVFGRALLGGTVHRVLETAPADVAIFVNRESGDARRILVPYLGSTHDRLALELAQRLARSAPGTGGAAPAIRVLHVVPPKRTGSALGAQAEVDRVFAEPGQDSPVRFQVVEDDSPVDAVLREARSADLVIIGIGEDWGLESQLFGFRPERIALECPTSLLIVRKFGRATSPAAPPAASGSTGGEATR